MSSEEKEGKPEECDLAVQNEAEVAVVEFKLAMPRFCVAMAEVRVVELSLAGDGGKILSIGAQANQAALGPSVLWVPQPQTRGRVG
jgi:hypothetical protein